MSEHPELVLLFQQKCCQNRQQKVKPGYSWQTKCHRLSGRVKFIGIYVIELKLHVT